MAAAVPTLCFPTGSANTAHPIPIFHSKRGLIHQTWAEHTSKRGCSLRAAGWEGDHSKASPLPADPQAMLDTGITLLLWPAWG